MVMTGLQTVPGFPLEQTFQDTYDEKQGAFHAWKYKKLKS
jgi:hypothetical protein